MLLIGVLRLRKEKREKEKRAGRASRNLNQLRLNARGKKEGGTYMSDIGEIRKKREPRPSADREIGDAGNLRRKKKKKKGRAAVVSAYYRFRPRRRGKRKKGEERGKKMITCPRHRHKRAHKKRKGRCRSIILLFY